MDALSRRFQDKPLALASLRGQKLLKPALFNGECHLIYSTTESPIHSFSRHVFKTCRYYQATQVVQLFN